MFASGQVKNAEGDQEAMRVLRAPSRLHFVKHTVGSFDDRSRIGIEHLCPKSSILWTNRAASERRGRFWPAHRPMTSIGLPARERHCIGGFAENCKFIPAPPGNA